MSHAAGDKLGSTLNRQLIQRWLIVVIAYYISGRLGLAAPSIGKDVTLIWLPTGIAVAACLRWGWHMASAIWCGALIVNLSTGSSPLIASCIAIGNTLAPLFSTWLLQREGFSPDFKHRRDVLLLVLAAMLGMLISSTGGIGVLFLAEVIPAERLFLAWRIWWLGDTVGVLIAAPLLLTLSAKTTKEFGRHPIEVSVFFLLTGLVSWAIFLSPFGRYAVAFLPLPMVMWAALRFGVTGASLSVLLISVIAAWGTAIGEGSFSLAGHSEALLILWAFITALVIVNLIVTALLAETRNNSARLRLHSLILKNMDEGVQLIRTSDGVIVYTNPTFERMFGYGPDELISQHVTTINARGETTPEQTAERIIASLSSSGHWEGEVHNRRKDDTAFWTKARVSTFDHDELGLVWASVHTDITEQKAADAKIQFLAFYDALTELPNRRLLMERLRHLASTGKRGNQHAALLFVDLDQFKQLNDTYGHRYGDLLLIEVAKRLLDCVREGDTVARLGGDEFVIVLPGLSPGQVQARAECHNVAEKIRASLSRPYQLENISYQCSSSIGAALAIEHEINADELMRLADVAMYQAKARGRNRICIQDEEQRIASFPHSAPETD